MDDDDVLYEILLHLPPQPSSLPRASLVCKRWRGLASDPAFLRRFCIHHRKPPLLGFFSRELYFTPTLDPPDHIPAARFTFPQGRDRRWAFHGCRHGLAFLLNLTLDEAAVWDPITGSQRRVAFPPGFDNAVRSAAVMCAAGDDRGHVHGDCHLSPFKLVLVRTDNDHTRAFACLYESESAVWGNIISTEITDGIDTFRPSVLVGNALCWLLYRGGILEFDFGKQSLNVIERPTFAHVNLYSCFQIMQTEDSGLGLAILSEMSIQIWERKANSDGVLRWVLQKTVELDMLLSLGSLMGRAWAFIQGFDEDTNVFFLSTAIGVFVVQLESMQFRNISKHNVITYYPYTNFFAAGNTFSLDCTSNKIQLLFLEEESNYFLQVCAVILFMCLRVNYI